MTPQTPIQEILEYLQNSIKHFEQERYPLGYRIICRMYGMKPQGETIAHEFRQIRYLIENRLGVK